MDINFKLKDKLNEIASLGTCLIVFGISLYWLNNADYYYRQNFVWVCLLFLLYIVCFHIVTTNEVIRQKRTWVNVLLLGQLLSSYLVVQFLPLTFLSILTIIWVAVFSHFYPIKTTFIVLVVVMISWFTLYDYSWHERSIVFQAILYSTFHFFTLLMAYQTKEAEQAKKDVEKLNDELLAANQLLAQMTRQSERTRIARDLHDLLGHHLTALIINLQVAGHLSEGEVNTKVTQCHQLAKLLLSDVREAVSTLRENQSLGFKEMVLAITNNVPKLRFETQLDSNVVIDNMSLLKELLSCIQESITNSLKHSNADCFEIVSKYEDNVIILQLSDNGSINTPFNQGNGLIGITERVALFDGSVTFGFKEGFETVIKIPVPIFDKIN